MTLNINRVFPRNWYAVSYVKDIKKDSSKKKSCWQRFCIISG